MGNSSSHTHESLDKGFTRGTYGDVKNTKSASFRFSKRSPKKMDRLRRSFRDSFRRRKDRVPESSKPHQWQSDDQAVRSATCSFPVKYLGCVEVFESRGMQVCEEALKVLRNSRRRAIRGLLHVSGDGLRVVDDDTKGLIVDQTIEKVSFCAPDRNHERGFSYICRDGTTRRWMCHGFLAQKDSGERLSHAVGCAFAVCLERKQRRDTECGVTMTFDTKNSTFTRSGSFRTHTITERLAGNGGGGINNDGQQQSSTAIVTPQPKAPHNPFAIERPHVTPSMLERLERQGSFRAVGTQSPFKRQMSLRINDLPSNAERQKGFLDPLMLNGGGGVQQTIRTVSPIPEFVQLNNKQLQQQDTVAQLCQELSQGLSLLSRTNDLSDDLNFNNIMSINQNKISGATTTTATTASNNDSLMAAMMLNSSSSIIPESRSMNNTINNSNNSNNIDTAMSILSSTSSSSTYNSSNIPNSVLSIFPPPSSSNIPSYSTSSATVTTPPTPTTTAQLPKAEHWLGQVVKSTSPSPRRAPSFNNHSRAKSLSSGSNSITGTDPFDAEWVEGVTNTNKTSTTGNSHNTNPFISPPKPPAKSFQVQL